MYVGIHTCGKQLLKGTTGVSPPLYLSDSHLLSASCSPGTGVPRDRRRRRSHPGTVCLSAGQRQQWSRGSWAFVLLTGCQSILMEKGTWEQRFGGGEGGCHLGIWGKATQEEGTPVQRPAVGCGCWLFLSGKWASRGDFEQGAGVS